MRTRRIKMAPEVGAAVYHCMSKTVNGQMLFDDRAKEVLRKQLWLLAEFTGVQVLTYTILGNHFHVLVRIPQRSIIADGELLRRYELLHPKPTKYQSARLDVIRSQLATDGPEAQAWRRRQLALMGDVSAFMKLLKQRFAMWFNKTRQRFGPLFSDRFKSVLVEPRDRVIQMMAAYIDLNCVRAGITQDPRDYRFCGYAEAVAGRRAAQTGLMSMAGGPSWSKVQAGYRQILFGVAAGPREQGATIPLEAFRRVVKQGGQLPLATVLRCRLRYFNDGAVVGSRIFVEDQLARYRSRKHKRSRTAPRSLPAVTDWGELTTLRALRRDPLGAAGSATGVV